MRGKVYSYFTSAVDAAYGVLTAIWELFLGWKSDLRKNKHVTIRRTKKLTTYRRTNVGENGNDRSLNDGDTLWTSGHELCFLLSPIGRGHKEIAELI